MGNLYEFSRSLAVLPLKYPVCKQPKLAKHNLHYAVYHKNYIFVYKIVKKQVVVYNIIHAHTSPALFSA
jgi:hypothetical protein